MTSYEPSKQSHTLRHPKKSDESAQETDGSTHGNAKRPNLLRLHLEWDNSFKTRYIRCYAIIGS